MTLSPANMIPRTLSGAIAILTTITLALVGWLCANTIEMQRNVAVLTNDFNTYKETGGIPDYWQREIQANRDKNASQDETIVRLLFLINRVPADHLP